MCDPWKLLMSAGVIAGSAYHFWDKYINVERKIEEQLIVLKEPICSKETCPCVVDDCKKEPPKEKIKETDEQLRKRCAEIRDDVKKKRAEKRKKMKEQIKEEHKKNEREKMKKLGMEPGGKEEEAQPLSHDQGAKEGMDVTKGKEDAKEKAPAKKKKEDTIQKSTKDNKGDDKKK
uniref:Uncharacterized protein n=1 Tax=Lygus hesperus TaxID=30085 RepID=A0A0A9Z332_LYGHE